MLLHQCRILQKCTAFEGSDTPNYIFEESEQHSTQTMYSLGEILQLYAGGVFWPVFLIANIAALIASRAMTTATFSCIKQSTALGCFPRLKIVHTSRKFMGQIYIPVMNWFLLALSLVLVCSISSIYEIGNAYGNPILFRTYNFFADCSICFLIT